MHTSFEVLLFNTAHQTEGWIDHRTVFMSFFVAISVSVVRRPECSFLRLGLWWSLQGLRLVASTALLKWIQHQTVAGFPPHYCPLKDSSLSYDAVPQRASAPIAFRWGRSLYCTQTLITNRPRYEPLHNGPCPGQHNLKQIYNRRRRWAKKKWLDCMVMTRLAYS